MKYRTTNKDLRTYSARLIKVGYCAMQSLLTFESPTAYTCGVYGWNADVYEIGNTTICTGYRPVGTSPDYALLEMYEKSARDVLNNRAIDYDKKRELVTALLHHFLSLVTA